MGHTPRGLLNYLIFMYPNSFVAEIRHPEPLIREFFERINEKIPVYKGPIFGLFEVSSNLQHNIEALILSKKINDDIICFYSMFSSKHFQEHYDKNEFRMTIISQCLKFHQYKMLYDTLEAPLFKRYLRIK